MYNLFNAVEIEYKIYDTQGLPIYSNSFDISRNGTFQLWNCVTGTANPTGHVWYYIVYDILYCNGASYSDTRNFLVKYPSNKSSNEDPDEPEDPETSLSPPANSITLQDENIALNFVIIPNPNPGTFQIETNFPLEDIANFKITNLLGVPVYETQSLVSNTFQLQNTASGLHFIVAVLKNGTVLTQKMMIQR